LSASPARLQPEGDFIVDGKTVDLRELPGRPFTLWLGVMNNDAQLETRVNRTPSDLPHCRRPDRRVDHWCGGQSRGDFQSTGGGLPASRRSPLRFRTQTHDHHPQVLEPAGRGLFPVPPMIEFSDWYVIAVKGAPDVVLDLCTKYESMDDPAD
jgi:P-type Ca2+ transporter type 2C